jgi:putative RecB family exonuclease
MTYSHSRLESYRQCPQKFKFAYIDKIASDTEGIEAFMGSRVHGALEQLYKNLRFEKQVSLEGVLAEYQRDWDAQWHEGIVIVREEVGPSEYFKMGQRAITDYYQRYYPFDQSKTLGLEYRITLELDSAGKYALQGFVDRLSQPSDGVLWIHDYKAKGNLPTQPEIDEDRQLAFYQMAVEKLWPNTQEVVLIWHYLLFDREFRSSRTTSDLAALRDETIALIDEIESASEFPTKQSGLCNWCEYRPICPLFKHLYETTPLPKNEYMKEQGVALVSQFMALQSEAERIKLEIEQVKEAMVAYAQTKKVDILYNKTHKVRVRVYPKMDFPGKSDPGRAKLETAVKEAGIWNDVATLDTFVLSKKLQDNTWPPDQVAKIKKAGVAGKTIWVKLFGRDER